MDCSFIDVILSTNLIFLASKLEVFVCSGHQRIAKIVTKHQNDLNFGGSQIQTPEIAITFIIESLTDTLNFRIVHTCMLLFDKSNKRSTQLETAVIKI